VRVVCAGEAEASGFAVAVFVSTISEKVFPFSMAFEYLSAKDQEIVLRCMKAAAAYLDESEIHTRMGIEAGELQRQIALWPEIDDQNEGGIGFLAVNNSMNEVCHGFRIEASDWGNWFDTPKEDVVSAYRRWLALTRASGGIQ
jgi:hypothetical protein